METPAERTASDIPGETVEQSDRRIARDTAWTPLRRGHPPIASQPSEPPDTLASVCPHCGSTFGKYREGLEQSASDFQRHIDSHPRPSSAPTGRSGPPRIGEAGLRRDRDFYYDDPPPAPVSSDGLRLTPLVEDLEAAFRGGYVPEVPTDLIAQRLVDMGWRRAALSQEPPTPVPDVERLARAIYADESQGAGGRWRGESPESERLRRDIAHRQAERYAAIYLTEAASAEKDVKP